ncbi:MAG TPA: DUF2795 domain-containing protein [Rhodocyclaceae bacterium]|nr:DUF2795 domain-containing protein [Rhodocyclaceae bacterium]
MARATAVEVQKYLKGVNYPASKSDILRRAESAGADDEIREALQDLPDGEDFETPAALSKALGGKQSGSKKH